MRQRQTMVIGTTSAVLFVLLIFCTLFWLGIIPFPFHKEFSRAPEPQVYTPCLAEGAKPLDMANINVRVYNASDTEGLAAGVAETLTAGGVTVAETSNWAGSAIDDSAVIYTSKKGTPAAYTLRAFFPNAKVIFDPTLVGEQVDVVLGPKWNGDTDLVAAPTEEHLTEAMKPISGCTNNKDIPDDGIA